MHYDLSVHVMDYHVLHKKCDFPTHHLALGVQPACRAKVHQLDVPRASDQHILWFHVSVDKPQLVQVLQTHGYL